MVRGSPPDAGRPDQRALARQFEDRIRRAAALRGREDEVRTTLATRWERVHRRLVRAGLEPADPRLLEIGSGPLGLVIGSGSSRAVRLDPLAVSYTGLFPAWPGQVPTVAADGDHLPFGDGSFDVVLCNDVVDRYRDPAGVVAEVVRVLAPGGLLYLTVDVHHPVYSVFARAHRAWNAVGIPLEIGAFAERTVHLTPPEARRLLKALPLDVFDERTYIGEARERARHRRIRHPGHLLPMVFFKNARYQVVARRR